MSKLFEAQSTVRRAIIDPFGRIPYVRLHATYSELNDSYSCSAVNEIGATVVETSIRNTVFNGAPVSYFSDIR